MNRRTFLRALGIATAGIAVPELILPPEPEKRFWALDRTMVGGGSVLFQYDVSGTSYEELRRRMVRDVEFIRVYRKMQLELERSLIFGEYDTPMGEFVKSQGVWGR